MHNQEEHTNNKTILVFNCHEAWVYQLSVLGYALDIIIGLKGRYKQNWDEQMRPVPANSVPPGRAQIIVNGDTGPTGPVSCSTDDGLTTISVGENSLGVTVVVTDDDMPAVTSVSIGDVGGVALGFAVGAAGRAPTAYRNGATLIVSGSGSGTDSANPARLVDSGYQIAVACP